MTNPGDQVPAGDDYIVRRLDDLQRQINQLGPSIASSFNTTFEQLQNQFASGWANTVSPVITPSGTAVWVDVTVPDYATSCGYTVFGCGGGLNTTGSAGYLTVRVDVDYGDYHANTYTSQSNIAAGAQGTVLTPQIDTISFPPGGGTLRLTASIYNGSGSWTNTAYNSIFPEGLFIFQR